MQRVKSVGVLSAAKISGMIFTCVELLLIPMLFIGGLASLASGQKSAAASGIVFFAIAILAPIFYGVMGFVVGAIQAAVYNLAAKWMGGIEIELETQSSRTTGGQIGLI